jgi:hypothetical protein
MRRNIRFAFQHAEVSAAMSVAAVLIAGVLTKAGHAWWGVAAMTALCVLGAVVEQSVSVRRFGQALDRPRHLIKSVQPTSDQASISAAQTVQV